MKLLVFFLILALSVSFLCSLLESILLSVTHAYVAVLKHQGRRSGHILRRMKRSMNHPLAAILSLNTIANVVGASGVGAQAYQVFGQEWMAAVSAIITVLILVGGEIIPKTIGSTFWKPLAPLAAYLIQGLIIIMYPVVKILEVISGAIAKQHTGTRVTREEIVVLAEMGVSEGVLAEREARVMKNLLLLNNIRAGDIATPRNVVFALERDQTIGEAVTEHSTVTFSRIPVYTGDLDHIVGVVRRNALLESYNAGNGASPLDSLMRPVLAVPYAKSAADLLEEFISRREHLFVVVDEYGGTEGIVTLEDAIETLLGVEILDEFDSVEDMRAYATEQWKRRRHPAPAKETPPQENPEV